MKKFTLVLALLFATFATVKLAPRIPLQVAFNQAEAKLLGAPYSPEVDARFNCLEGGSCTGYATPTIPFSSLVSGNSTSASGHFPLGFYKSSPVSLAVAAGTYNTSIVLPAKTVIKQAWLMFPTAPANTAGTTTAVQCDNANDILSAADETAQAANSIIAGVETGTAATMHYSSAGCTVKVVTAVHTGTVGSIVVYLETFPAN